MENLKEKKQGKIIGFLCIVCLVLAVSSGYFAFSANRYKRQEKLTDEKAVSALCESLDGISVSLKKGIYSADGKALSKIGNELCRQAAVAKENLNLLAPDNEFADEIYRFLSQVGNYTLAVASDKESLTAEDADKLKALYDYAQALSDGMNEICYDYYNGDVSFGKAIGNIEVKQEKGDFYSRVSDTAQTLGDYPTLTYDGPFADNLMTVKSDFIGEKGEITTEEAAERAAKILGVQPSSLKREENISSDIELYCFSKGKTDVTITKNGGYLCTLLSDAYAYEETISAKEAVRRGEEYLEKLGYDDMKSSYYSVYDGICTVNYAFEQDGVICYPDLIKVSISLDSGALVGLDAKPFLIHHRERKPGKPVVSVGEAVGKLSPVLTLIDRSLAVIPLDTGKEAFCYELHCKDGDGQEVLVYINAKTGKQEDLLILLYSDGGVLTK